MDCSLPDSSVHEDSPVKNIKVGCHTLLQGFFPTQGSNPDLPHCRWILSHLSHQGSPRILEGVACPFSSRSSQSRNQTQVSCIAGGFFTSWATRKACISLQLLLKMIILNSVLGLNETNAIALLNNHLSFLLKFFCSFYFNLKV